jgi:hypothetical protein
MAEQANGESTRTLDSWKEIAAFLRRGVRTVQRWELTEGLPVRRHRHMKRGSVCAVPAELADWQQGRQLGFRLRNGGPTDGQAMDQFDRLRRLMLRQTVLARELGDLLAVHAATRDRMRQLNSSSTSSLDTSTMRAELDKSA